MLNAVKSSKDIGRVMPAHGLTQVLSRDYISLHKALKPVVHHQHTNADESPHGQGRGNARE